MVRKKMDPFWKHVEIRPKDRWMCKFCGNEHSGRVIRIKAHLGQVKNRGIDICNKVDDAVRDQALKALNLEPTQRQEDMVEETAQGNVAENISSIPPLSNFNEWQDLNPSIYNQNVPRDASHDVMSQSLPLSATQHTQFQPTVVLPDFYIQQHGMNSMMDLPILNFQPHNEGQSAGAGMLSPSTSSNLGERLGDLKRKVKRLRNENEEKEEELHHRKKKVKKIENAYEIIEEEWREGKLLSLQQVHQLEILIEEVEGLGIPGVSTKALSSAAHNNNHPPPLITTELIGRDKEMSEIWNYLVQDDILRVGLYGMGGVGKTEIAMHIYNKLLENEGFDHVFWATMPQDLTIYEIQEVIANAVHLDDLLMEKNEKIRAAMLHRFLISKKKSVLILDGLWRHFEFYDVGIPVKFHGLKLVITSRSLDVCRMMLCQAQIRISPLLDSRTGEDFKLFLVKLGLETELPSELKEIAVKLVSTCKGLPLYITAIARRMRGVKDVRHWKDMLEKMKDPKERYKEMKYSVYDTLKLSYRSLDDHQMQQCLTISAFHISSRRDSFWQISWRYENKRRNLVEFLVDVGLILGMDSRRKLMDKADAILDKLQNACLLDMALDMMMHDSIMDMALNIKSEKVLYTSHSAIGLKDILDKELWFEGLDEISFMIDGREESSNNSINFSKISVLLSNSPSFKKIPDLLLRLLPGLRILDLSGSGIKEIPHSISDLISLTALVLRDCWNLEQIPYIGKLTSLQKLDLYFCNSLTNLPDGLEYLVKLEYLNLYQSGIENLPRSILDNLRKLQYLWINYVKAEALVGLNKLELLRCSFSTVEELSLYARNLTDEGPSEYNICVGRPSDIEEHGWDCDYLRAVSIDQKEESHGDCIYLPKSIQYLRVESWIYHVKAEELVGLNKLESLRCSFSTVEELSLYVRNLTDEGPSEYNICVGRSSDTEKHEWDCEYPRAVSIYQNEESHANCISLPKSIQYLCVESWSNESIMLSDCAPLEDLEALEIYDCMKFGVIFGDQNEGIVLSNSNACPFPNLKTLYVISCSKLKYIFGPRLAGGCEIFEGIIAEPSTILGGFPINLEEIWIEHCRNLRFLVVSDEMLPCLKNLRSIHIEACEIFEGIIAAPSTILGGFPINLEQISIEHCRNMMSLAVPEMLPCLQNLRSISISDCNLKTFLSFEVFLNLQGLKELFFDHCPDLETIIEPASPTMHLTASATTHLNSHLTSLKIRNCPKMKRLLSHELLVHLCNLQTLEVEHCDMLEELTDTYDELNGDLCTVTPLPNLKALRLEYLPELRSIGAISIGSSLEVIIVIEAPQIKRIPLQMSQLPNGLPAPPSSLRIINIRSRDWWESLEWESQGVKDILQTFVVFI